MRAQPRVEQGGVACCGTPHRVLRRDRRSTCIDKVDRWSNLRSAHRNPCALWFLRNGGLLFPQQWAKPARRLELPRFLYVKLWKMLTAASTQELLELIPINGIDTARPGFSQVMPFLCELSPGESGKERTSRRSLLARRRACSSRTVEKRVSRLIGNSDTTAKASGWQVALAGEIAAITPK
jgi:hypothetical protein